MNQTKKQAATQERDTTDKNESQKLNDVLNRLIEFDSGGLPVISLYLNAQANAQGRDQYDRFIRREFSTRAKTFDPRTPEGESFRRDAERIEKYLAEEVRPSANGVAIFACAGKDEFFLPVQLDAPIERHQMFAFAKPHLYPLARLIDESRRYAVLVADTNRARIFVFGRGRVLAVQAVQSEMMSRTQVGGWSQMRYQRHVDNLHLHHAKEVVEALDRILREEAIETVIIAGDEVVLPLLRQQMSPELAKKAEDTIRLDIRSPEHEIMERTRETFRARDTMIDQERVEELNDAVRGTGLGVAGAADTLAALLNGQVDELFLTAGIKQIEYEPDEVGVILAAYAPGEEGEPPVAGLRRIVVDELIRRAMETGARIHFIENATLLAAMGGVGATLRYNL
jgi:peptide chain release factor subunit 1